MLTTSVKYRAPNGCVNESQLKEEGERWGWGAVVEQEHKKTTLILKKTKKSMF